MLHDSHLFKGGNDTRLTTHGEREKGRKGEREKGRKGEREKA
jgi:hypothetical protein